MSTPEGTVALPNGQLVLAQDTHLSRWAEQHKSVISDPHLMRFLDPHLKNVEVVWDIGAFIGDHTRHYCDLGKTVVAFEPNPLAFKCLDHNCPEAECFNIAASDHEGTLEFTQLDNAGASRIREGGEIAVLCHALDDLPFVNLPGYVKIDVEGWEPKVLFGMQRILKEAKPILFIEINRGALADNNFDPEDITDFLKSLGYHRIEMYPRRANWSDPQFDILVLP